jgi:CrcB protein
MGAMVWVVLGSALGGMARYWLSGAVGRTVGETFPWGTMAVNVSGALAIGIVAAIAARGGWAAGEHGWPLVVIGLLGSYTTVSSFSLQTLALARDGEWRRAAANVALSVVLCLSAAAVGLVLGGALAGAR